ncbi:hypothetical protein [uncultured Tateyamaria sp.]|uniref:hypothetical protein n=1 Tax=uncultured Tateyamaria sp. TaxID=455651 RepID=UPI0026370A49|nr:hypothetical protein [uncultured Tateyamaria sp.]
MQALTGQIVELEGKNLTDDDQMETAIDYLENNTVGGGIMTDLPSNENTLKATMVLPGGSVERVSIPTTGFLGANDVVTVVQDEDGCEMQYINHTTGRKWSYPRSPEHIRKRFGLIRFGINQSLLWASLLGIVAGLAQGQFTTLNLIVITLIAVFLYCAIWSLSVRPRAIKKHHASARAAAETNVAANESFIQAKADERLGRLKAAAGV